MGDYAPGSFVGGQEPVPLPKFYGGSATVIGKMRDQLMEQFPGVNSVQDSELEMTAQQKMGFFAFAISNPAGALDIVRDRQGRHAKRKARAAAMNLKMLEISKDVITSQDRNEQAMFTARQSAATAERQDRQLELDEEYKMGMLDMQEAEMGLKRQRGEREEENQQMLQATLGDKYGMGTDVGGNPISTPSTEGAGRSNFKTSFSVAPGGTTMNLTPEDLPKKFQAGFFQYLQSVKSPYETLDPEAIDAHLRNYIKLARNMDTASSGGQPDFGGGGGLPAGVRGFNDVPDSPL